MQPATNSALFVQSFARGLEVIESFGQTPRMTLTEVAEATGLSRATVRRFVHTLVSLGYMRANDKHFALTPKVMNLGFAYLASQPLVELVDPVLANLSQELGQSTSVSVLDGTDVVYIARQETTSIMRINITVGTRFPAYATSMGRVLLAGLEAEKLDEYFAAADLTDVTDRTLTDEAALRSELGQIRKQGYAVVKEELEVGLASVAVPIRNRAGVTVAAMNTSVAVTSQAPEDLTELLPPLQAAADEVSNAL
ncbi:IclR family transcriptional regulator domain-containing protein [Enteractinococcus coprophilus]|uniref:IclR family transcriptional regulator n=1 Tax=Enteractinococcus coprophilus TaxID=1027633 RepID=A0A543AFU6_9MICC|nr:IclR family transcriptional regulator C-terminal domain-containing protein [Enteractinococcus coprophilus]TQL71448.1 IclR family transcriptional regulator [Enteractinococcus coprophilus]